jgi:hypothetical protein
VPAASLGDRCADERWVSVNVCALRGCEAADIGAEDLSVGPSLCDPTRAAGPLTERQDKPVRVEDLRAASCTVN